MSAELLPCPFCGGEAVRNMGHLGDGSPWPYVECLDCTACAEPEMWNRRAAPQSQESANPPSRMALAAAIARLTERCDAYKEALAICRKSILRFPGSVHDEALQAIESALAQDKTP